MSKVQFKISLMGIALLLGVLLLTSCSKYKYETVANDPMKTRIYTLKNGLKVYLSVNKGEPRIQTMIAINAGSKNDPSETTGLAHYFEHLMFKGTKNFGTVNYAEEEPYLNQIQALFEKYRTLTDQEQRRIMYHVIDSVSQIASSFAIPNEYDKLMASIGAQGTNAFTSNDLTAYIEDIPSNQVENWLKIQLDRFQNPVIRLFHTELETVYEEYNMGLASDGRRVWDSTLAALFPHHPYGTQSVIGTQENLKNPSIINIKNFFSTYYVPNNMAIIMAGDFDPDKVIEQIDKYFGQMKPSDTIPALKTQPEKAITAPIEKTVVGNDPAFVQIAFRLPAPSTKGIEVADLMGSILQNGSTGLVDVNLIQKQKVLSAYAGYESLADYGLLSLGVFPRQGQSLEEARDLMLEQIEKIKKGDFSEDMLRAIIENTVTEDYYKLRYNTARTFQMLESFVEHTPWADKVSRIDKLSKITKDQVVEFAKQYCGNNYAVVYKREGNPQFSKMGKPHITPLTINRDTSSQFLKQIQLSKPADIEPVFLNFNTDLSKTKLVEQVEVISRVNTEDPLFNLHYVFEMGRANDKSLDMAFQYLKYLGTDKYTPEQLQNEFYKIAVKFEAVASFDRAYISLSGLDKNLEPAIALLEHLLSSIKADVGIYANLAKDELKKREDAKKEQESNYTYLYNYIRYGADNPLTYVLSNKEIQEMNPETLTTKIKNLTQYPHEVLYYGPRTEDQLVSLLKKEHKMPKQFQSMPEEHLFNQIEQDGKKVYLAYYDAPQVYVALVSRLGLYDPSITAVQNMYEMYFGGSMGSIVFQEMREARALAYMAYMTYIEPRKPKDYVNGLAVISTQVDKMGQAVLAFKDIIYNMPMSPNTFDVAKENFLNSFRTRRNFREDVLWFYLHCQRFGYKNDYRKENYEKVQKMTIQDVKAYHEKYVKPDLFDLCVLGNTKQIDMKFLKSQGEVTTLTATQLFGY